MNKSFPGKYEVFLKGGGEMGKAIREFNWSRTSLKDPAEWDLNLLSAVKLMLNTAQPMMLCWGEEMIQCCNDRFQYILAKNKIPALPVATSARNYWPSWHLIQPQVDRLMQQGESFTVDNIFFIPGEHPDAQYALSFNSVLNDDSIISGIIILCIPKNSNSLPGYPSGSFSESEQIHEALFTYSPLPKWIFDIETLRILEVNNTAVKHYGYSRNEFLNMTIKDLRPKNEIPIFEEIRKNVNTNVANEPGVFTHLKKDGTEINVEIFAAPYTFQNKVCRIVDCNDITDRLYYQKLDKLENTILALNARGDKALNEMLSMYVSGIEKLHPGMFCSIQKLVGSRLFNLSAPNLPAEFLNAIEGGQIGPNEGSCGAAAFLKKKITVSDIATDIHWVNYKDAALKHGLKACWSNPILDNTGNVIATFASYAKEIRNPSEREENTIQRAVNILKIILENHIREKSVREANQRFEYATSATSDIIWDWNLENKEVFYSPNITNLIGETSGTNMQEEYFENIHPEDKERVVEYLHRRSSENLDNWTLVYQIKRKDGSYAFVQDKGRLIRNEAGAAIRMVGAVQDISKQMIEEQRLKFFETIITNINDAVLITEAENIDSPGPKIMYVNDAFTRMTGYTADEAIGQSPRFLQGHLTDRNELDKMKEAMRTSGTCEVTLLNYKKNGEKFWVNLALSSILDSKGNRTHFLAVERDITNRKTEELQKTLWSEISLIFNEPISLIQSLNKILARVTEFGNYILAEVWLINSEKSKINLTTGYYATENSLKFRQETSNANQYNKNEGLAGLTWNNETLQVWYDHRQLGNLERNNAATKYGVKQAYGLPLFYNREIIGVLVVGLDHYAEQRGSINAFNDNFSGLVGAEIKRKLAEQELNRLFDFAPDIICIAGFNGYFKKINPAASVLLEYSEEELLSVPFNNFIHPDDRNRTGKELENLNDGRHVFYFENRYITRSGKIKWLAWTCMPSSSEQLIYAVAKDITAKKELENLLNHANMLARIGGWEYDLRYQTLYWSEITKEIYEVTPDFIPDLQRTMNFYIHEEDKELMLEKVAQATETGKEWDLELQIRTLTGIVKWIRYIGQAEMIEGVPVKLFGSIQDIDARKKVELALEDSLAEKSDILESIGDAFFALDKNWVVSYWNKRAEKELLKTKKEMIGKVLWDMFPDIPDQSYNKYHEAIATNRSLQFEDYYPPINKWYDVNAYPSKNGLSVYFKDISERKSAEERLKELNKDLEKNAKELKRSNAELEQFAYVASHDLQEPLRMVSSFLTMLDKNYGHNIDEKGRRYIEFAVDGARRMQNIILDLLDFSLIDRTEDIDEMVDVAKVVEEIEKLFIIQIQEKKASIIVGQLPKINAHMTHIRQIFQNLISNALKYSKNDVPVTIHITSENMADFWKFTISDNGIGIEEKYYQKIFLMFQRLHHKNQYSGTGMGLAITQKIINSLGGEIQVSSNFGIGTTFSFTLPKIIRIT